MKNSLFLVMALAMVFFCALPAFALDDADGHQLWDDYPRSPQLTSSYPHQVITNYNSHPILRITEGDFYVDAGKLKANHGGLSYEFYDGAWHACSPISFNGGGAVDECI